MNIFFYHEAKDLLKYLCAQKQKSNIKVYLYVYEYKYIHSYKLFIDGYMYQYIILIYESKNIII